VYVRDPRLLRRLLTVFSRCCFEVHVLDSVPPIPGVDVLVSDVELRDVSVPVVVCREDLCCVSDRYLALYIVREVVRRVLGRVFFDRVVLGIDLGLKRIGVVLLIDGVPAMWWVVRSLDGVLSILRDVAEVLCSSCSVVEIKVGSVPSSPVSELLERFRRCVSEVFRCCSCLVYLILVSEREVWRVLPIEYFGLKLPSDIYDALEIALCRRYVTRELLTFEK